MSRVPIPPLDQVFVFTVSLGPHAARLEHLVHTLSSDERRRADAFRFDRDRRRFIACRGMLRALMGTCLGVAPQDVAFEYSAHGKPRVAEGHAAPGLRFNLAHSGALALIAVTRGREVGVDVEEIRPLTDEEQLAERFFSPTESRALRSLPRSVRNQGFFACWTRKEAYLKALGEGLTRPLRDFTVTVVPGEPARLLSVKDEPEEIERWSLAALQPDGGFAAAIAVAGHGWRLVERRVTGPEQFAVAFEEWTPK